MSQEMYASFPLRLKAFLIDYVLIFAYLIVLAIVGVLFAPVVRPLFSGSLVVAQLSGFLTVTLPVSLYYIASETRFGGQSFGKRKAGIRATAADGGAIALPRSVLRTALKFLPWELSHFLVYRLVAVGEGDVPTQYALVGGLVYALMFAYLLSAIFTKRKQALYDLVAGTQVVKTSA